MFATKYTFKQPFSNGMIRRKVNFVVEEIRNEFSVLYNYGMIFYINHFRLIIFHHSVWLGFGLFGLVQVQVHTLSTVHVRPQSIWQSQIS